MSPTATPPRRPWSIPEGGRPGFSADGYLLGKGSSTRLEVAFATAKTRPADGDVRSLWKRRHNNQASPLLLVVSWQNATGESKVSVCGPVGDEPPVHADRDLDQVMRIAALCLDEPSHHAAVRLLDGYLSTETGGLRNKGLFATHHLRTRIPTRPDWAGLCNKGEKLVSLRREELLHELGFSLDPQPFTSSGRA